MAWAYLSTWYNKNNQFGQIIYTVFTEAGTNLKNLLTMRDRLYKDLDTEHSVFSQFISIGDAVEKLSC